MSWFGIAAAVIGAGAGLYGQNKARQTAKDLQKQQQPLINTQLQNSQFLGPYGQGLLNQYQQGSSMYGDRLKALMSGNPSLTNAYLAPQINAMTQAEQGATSAQRGMFPRGGALASQAGNRQQQLQGSLANMRFGAMNDATNQYGGFLQGQAGTGLGALGMGSGLTNNMLNYGLNAQGQMFGQGQAIGQGIGNFISPFLQYALQNYGGGKSTPSPYLPTGSSPSQGPYTNPFMGSSPSQFPTYSVTNPYSGNP